MKPLTEVELQVMNAVWDLRDCTIKEVQEYLLEDRNVAYTTVATIMKILEQKGVLKSTKGEKAHVYIPLVSRDDYEKTALTHVAENVFRGDPSSMVMRLLSDSSLSQTELQNIRSLLEEKLGEKQDG